MKDQTNVSMNSTNITCPNCGIEIDNTRYIFTQIGKTLKKKLTYFS